MYLITNTSYKSNMEFKDKMIYARAMLKYSQAKMAKELGVSFATINRWENDNNSPSKTMIVLFEDYCKKHNINFDEERVSND